MLKPIRSLLDEHGICMSIGAQESFEIEVSSPVPAHFQEQANLITQHNPGFKLDIAFVLHFYTVCVKFMVRSSFTTSELCAALLQCDPNGVRSIWAAAKAERVLAASSWAASCRSQNRALSVTKVSPGVLSSMLPDELSLQSATELLACLTDAVTYQELVEEVKRNHHKAVPEQYNHWRSVVS